MFKKIISFFLIFSIFVGQAAHALEPPLSGSQFGKELASAMAARSRVTMLSRVVGRLGPYGLLASIAIPAVYDWYKNEDGTVNVPNSAASQFPVGIYYATDLFQTVHTGSSVEQVGYATMIANEGTADFSTLYWTPNPVVENSPNVSYTYSGHWKLKSGGTNSWPRTVSVRQGTYGGSFPQIPSPALPSSGSSKMSVEEAIAKLTQAQKEAIIPAQQIADALNKIIDDHKLQPNAVNEPYFTAVEIEAIRAKTGVRTRVGDLGSPLEFPDLASVQNPNTQNQNTTPSSFDFTVPPSTSTVENIDIPATYTPTFFTGATGCPAPISFTIFGTTYQLEYTYMCSLMQTVAPIFVTLGAMSSALIFARGFKS